ncbi:MAG: hypothetical protein ACK4PR_02215, partial [Gammaproteobacteria bacterium]
MPQTNSIISNPLESQSALMEEHIHALVAFITTQSAEIQQDFLKRVMVILECSSQELARVIQCQDKINQEQNEVNNGHAVDFSNIEKIIRDNLRQLSESTQVATNLSYNEQIEQLVQFFNITEAFEISSYLKHALNSQSSLYAPYQTIEEYGLATGILGARMFTDYTATLNQSVIERFLTQPGTDTLANGFFNLLVDNVNARATIKSICTNDEIFFQLADRLLITAFTRYDNLTLTTPPLWWHHQKRLVHHITDILSNIPAAQYRAWIESLSNRLPLGVEFVLFESFVEALCQQGQPIDLLDAVFVNKQLEAYVVENKRQKLNLFLNNYLIPHFEQNTAQAIIRQLMVLAVQKNKWVFQEIINALKDIDKTKLKQYVEQLQSIPVLQPKLFIIAASLGLLAYLENQTVSITPDALLKMIRIDNYEVFREAAKNGYLEILNWLKQEAPDELLKMALANNYSAFCWAACHGHLEVLNWLKQEVPGTLLKMIRADKYYAFRLAAENGYTEVLNWLKQELTDELLKMIREDKYFAFRGAIEYGHLEVLNWLKQEAPDELLQMIRADKYFAFRWAAENGYLAVLKWLKQEVPDKLLKMIRERDYYAFRMAARNNHSIVVKYLLSFPDCLNYAEMHEQEYGEKHVIPFITSRLLALRTLQAEQPDRQLTEEETKLCFYMLRNLIRRRNAVLLDDMHFLLTIPQVQAILHEAITPNKPNELLILALTLENQAAVQALMTIPAVRQLAEENRYYEDELSGRAVNLRAIAEDKESAIRALTPAEEKRLNKLKAHYAPMIEQAGVDNLLTWLKEFLADRYTAAPAVVTLMNGKELSLPVSWAEFEQLELTPAERELANKAYYKHKDHTALRWLSKPNRWMSPRASYVEVDSANQGLRYANLGGYEELIVTFMLAAIDEEIKPLEDKVDIIDRIVNCIVEIAGICRVHNWDKERPVTRTRVLEDGTTVEETVTEQYDDEEGDKPSCWSGVKTRLFQSLMWHRLFNIMTAAMVEYEMRFFLQARFKDKLTACDDASKQAIRD